MAPMYAGTGTHTAQSVQLPALHQTAQGAGHADSFGAVGQPLL